MVVNVLSTLNAGCTKFTFLEKHTAAYSNKFFKFLFLHLVNCKQDDVVSNNKHNFPNLNDHKEK